MGQYYKVVNLTKKQVIDPHTFGDGAKLMEFGCSVPGMMTALALLLADGNGRGGGDMRSDSDLIGSWAGDKVVIGGDYADHGKFTKSKTKSLYEVSEKYENISEDILCVMAQDYYVQKSLQESMKWRRDNGDLSEKVIQAVYGSEPNN